MSKVIDIYEVTTTRNRKLWVAATTPGRAISKTHRCKRMLDRGEKVKSVELVGTVDIP